MEQNTVYRHEEKYLISPSDRILISSRLRAVLPHDKHASEDGTYRIRSVYFDDRKDNAFHDSLDGVLQKQKYRLRMYNNDTSVIFLEKKIKKDNVGTKKREKISFEEAQSLLSGQFDFLSKKDSPLCLDFYSALRSGLHPVSIVDYRRTAFFSAPGNIRITIDDDIRTDRFCENFFKGNTGIPFSATDSCLLEIKYDSFLPDHIKKLISVRDLFRSGFSKYTKSRKII